MACVASSPSVALGSIHHHLTLLLTHPVPRVRPAIEVRCAVPSVSCGQPSRRGPATRARPSVTCARATGILGCPVSIGVMFPHQCSIFPVSVIDSRSRVSPSRIILGTCLSPTLRCDARIRCRATAVYKAAFKQVHSPSCVTRPTDTQCSVHGFTLKLSILHVPRRVQTITARDIPHIHRIRRISWGRGAMLVGVYIGRGRMSNRIGPKLCRLALRP